MGTVFLLGIVTGFGFSLSYCGLFAIILFTFLAFKRSLFTKKRFAGLLIIFLVLFSLGFLYSSVKIYDFKKESSFFKEEKSLTIQGKIYNKEKKDDSFRVYLKDLKTGENSRFNYRAILFFDEDPGIIGSSIKANCDVLEFSPVENEGGFDYEKYLMSEKIAVALSPIDFYITNTPPFSLREVLFKYKQAINSFYTDHLPGEESGLLSSMVIGDRYTLEYEAGELFRKAGISHILAISGLHLSIIGSALYSFLRKRGLSFKTSSLVSSFAVLVYGLFAGNPVSLLRAMGMFILDRIANITGRTNDTLNSLVLIMTILIVNNPFLIYSGGFILSFGAILGITLFANQNASDYKNLCKKRYESIYKVDHDKPFSLSKKETFVSALISGFSFWIFSLPLLAYLYSEIPLYVIFVNLIVIPFLALLLIFGLISGLFFFSPTLMVCHFILFYYEMICDFVTTLPFSTLVLPKPSLKMIVLFYSLLAIFIILLKKAEISLLYKNILPLNSTLDNKSLKIAKRLNPKGYLNYKIISRLILKKITAYFLICTLLFSLLKFTGPKGFYIDMLSVGQGDGILIRSKENVTFFVDGGSSSKSNLGRYTLLPYLRATGVDHIDFWLLSHLDDDHINGFLELLNGGYRIKNLCLSKSIEKSETLDRILSLCEKNDTLVSFLVPGDSLGTESLSIRVIYPNYPPTKEGANENSLCFVLAYENLKAVFTGDMGIDEEKELMESGALDYINKKSNILLKVAHHGSKNSSLDEWLKYLSPNLAIISAGKNNRYGHPSKETLKRLGENSIPYLCTIDRGRIRITLKDGKIKAEGFINPN